MSVHLYAKEKKSSKIHHPSEKNQNKIPLKYKLQKEYIQTFRSEHLFLKV